MDIIFYLLPREMTGKACTKKKKKLKDYSKIFYRIKRNDLELDDMEERE